MPIASTKGTRARVGAPPPGRTADEVLTGRSRPPTSVPLRALLDVEHLDGNHDLPVLRLRRAA